jgi:hypothetical protein
MTSKTNRFPYAAPFLLAAACSSSGGTPMALPDESPDAGPDRAADEDAGMNDDAPECAPDCGDLRFEDSDDVAEAYFSVLMLLRARNVEPVGRDSGEQHGCPSIMRSEDGFEATGGCSADTTEFVGELSVSFYTDEEGLSHRDLDASGFGYDLDDGFLRMTVDGALQAGFGDDPARTLLETGDDGFTAEFVGPYVPYKGSNWPQTPRTVTWTNVVNRRTAITEDPHPSNETFDGQVEIEGMGTYRAQGEWTVDPLTCPWELLGGSVRFDGANTATVTFDESCDSRLAWSTDDGRSGELDLDGVVPALPF